MIVGSRQEAAVSLNHHLGARIHHTDSTIWLFILSLKHKSSATQFSAWKLLVLTLTDTHAPELDPVSCVAAPNHRCNSQARGAAQR